MSARERLYYGKPKAKQRQAATQIATSLDSARTQTAKTTRRNIRAARTRNVYKSLSRDINKAQAGESVQNKDTRRAVWAGVRSEQATGKVEKALKVGIRTGKRQPAVKKFMKTSRAIVDVEDAAKELKKQGKSVKKNPQAFNKAVARRQNKRADRRKVVRKYQERKIQEKVQGKYDYKPYKPKPKPKPAPKPKPSKADLWAKKHGAPRVGISSSGRAAGPTVINGMPGHNYGGHAGQDVWNFVSKKNLPGTKALGEVSKKIYESKNPVVRALSAPGQPGYQASKALGYTDGITPLEAAAAVPVSRGVKAATQAPSTIAKASRVVKALGKAAERFGGKPGAKVAAKAKQSVAKAEARTAQALKVKKNPPKKPAPKKPAAKQKTGRVAQAKTTVKNSKVGQTATKAKNSKAGQTAKSVTQGKAAPEGSNPTGIAKLQNWRATSKGLAKYRTGRKWARRAGVGYLGAATVGKPLGANLPGENAVPGTIKANPLKAGLTTVEVIPSLFVGAISDIKNVARSDIRLHRDLMAKVGLPGGKDYSKQEILYPAKTTLDHNIDFFKQMAKVYGSGSVEEVKKFTEEDMGYWGVGMVAPHAREPIGDLRGAVRPRARAAATARRDAARAAAKENPTPNKKAKPRNIKDSKTGEEYVFNPIGKAIEGKRKRTEVSRDTARELDHAEISSQKAARVVISNLRKSTHSGRKVRRANDGVDAQGIFQTVSAFGISRNKAKAMRQIRDIRKNGRDANTRVDGHITDANALDFLENNPSIFKDKNFWNAIDEYRKVQEADKINFSTHKRLRLIGDLYGVKTPEARITAAGKKHGWKGEVMKETVIKWKQDATKARAAAKRASGKEKKKLLDKAKRLEKRRAMYIKVSRKAYDDYNKRVNEIRKQKGYELPSYVAQRDINMLENRLVSGPKFPANRTASRTHKLENKSGPTPESVVADRSFDGLLQHSVKAPRVRQRLHHLTRGFVSREAIPIKGKKVVTTQDVIDAVRSGEIDPKTHVVMHSQHFKQALLDFQQMEADQSAKSLMGKLENGYLREDGTQAPQAIYSPNQLAKATIKAGERKGHKYVVVSKAAANELEKQLSPPSMAARIVGTPGRMLSSLILGTSVSWAVSQVVADAIPLFFTQATSPAGMARLARAARDLAKESSSLTEREKTAIQATVGESIGANGYVVNFGLSQGKLRKMWHDMTGDYWSVADRGAGASTGRFMMQAAKGISTIERLRASKYRQVAALALTDKAIANGVVNLGNVLKLQREVSLKLKDMPATKRLAWLAEHPEYGRRLENAIDENMGSWRAMSSLEREIAPLLIFYPFMRFSIRWTLNTFPKNHPMVASTVAFLAAQNHQELEKLMGGPPGFFADWASGIDYNAPNDFSTTEYRRVAPGSNTLIEALGDTKDPTRTALRALNPAAGAIWNAATSTDPLTGQKYEDTSLGALPGRLASNAFGGVTPFRMADQLIAKGSQSRDRSTAPVIGKYTDKSWVSQMFIALDDPTLKNIRSYLFPFVPHKGSQFVTAQRASRLVKLAFGAPDRMALLDLHRQQGGKNTQEYRDALEQHRRGQKAMMELKQLARSLGINPDGTKRQQRIDDKTNRDVTNVDRPYQKGNLGGTSDGLSGGGGGLTSRGGL
jgi:hypothetical protein